jgi:hypothetical protein
MDKAQLLKYIQELPDDAEVCLAQHMIIDEKEEVVAVREMLRCCC